MKRQLDAKTPVEDGSPVGGAVLGTYTADRERRRVRAITSPTAGLCLVDEGSDGAVLVEPQLEGMVEARALAADYLALATERGAPQTRHPWPPDGGGAS
jgi:hypothetical protein